MSGDRAMEGNSISYQKKPRIMWIDIMRGLLMFWVIFGHITEDKAQIVYIYSFHMPAYFFLTGMTLAFRKDQRLGAFVLDKFLGLMVPYFVLNLYAAPFREWLEVVGEANSQSFPDLLFGIMYSNADSGYKMASNTLWFIPCLFLASVLFFCIKKLCSGDMCMMTTFTAALVFSCWVANLNHGGGGPSHYRGAIFSVVFVLAGYLFSQHRVQIDAAVSHYKGIALAAVPALLVIGWRLAVRNGYVSIIHNEYKSLLLFYASALVTTLALAIFLMLAAKSKAILKVCKPIDFIGRKTLPYIAFQVPFMKLMWHYMPGTFGTKAMPWLLLQTVILYFGMMPFAWAVDRYVPRASVLKTWIGAGRKRLGSGNVQYQEEYRK